MKKKHLDNDQDLDMYDVWEMLGGKDLKDWMMYCDEHRGEKSENDLRDDFRKLNPYDENNIKW